MFRDRKPTRGPAERGRGTFRFSGTKFRGAGGSRPWSARGRRFFDTPYNINKKNKLKEQKQEPKDGNPPAAEEGVPFYKQKMSITPDPERKLEHNEIDQIKEALLDALEPLEDGYYPQFHGATIVKGVLIMLCANEQTKQWLERTVPQLKPWEGAKLCVKSKGDVTLGTQVQLKTPKMFAKTDPKKILQMLSTQNKTLKTSTWKNIRAKSEASGQTLIYIVDDQSVEAIRALNNKAYLGLGNVELVILKNEEEGDKQTSGDTDVKSEKEVEEEDDGKKTSGDTVVKNEEEGDKNTSGDTAMKNKEGDKNTSGDTAMKNKEGDKKTSGDTVMKNEGEGDKQMSVDTEIKNEEKDDKQTS